MNMIDQCCKDLSQYDMIMINSTLMFIFTPKRTLVATPFHLFMIKHNHGNYIKKLIDLRDVVESGSIKNIADLLEYNDFKPGNSQSQFDGLELIRMELSWVN